MITTILITGCSEGLDRALAIQFAEKRYKVYAVARSAEKLETLAQVSPHITPIVADIATSDGRKKINENIRDEEKISIIHNATFTAPVKFDQLTEDCLRQHIETNLIAPLLITKDCLPLLVFGQRVLNITSGAASIALPGLLPYCITKSAMYHAMDCLSKELATKGVSCANLRPGSLDTVMQERFRKSDVSVLPGRDYYIQLADEQKLIKPEIAAKFVAWVLLNTDDESFNQTDWNIYDEKYYPNWLKQDLLYTYPSIAAGFTR